jgi:hypothetical protein
MEHAELELRTKVIPGKSTISSTAEIRRLTKPDYKANKERMIILCRLESLGDLH